MPETEVTPANPEFTLPQDLDAYVWRYMNMRKFHSMLTTSAVYLCRADRLERFEGTYSRKQIRDTDEYLGLATARFLPETSEGRSPPPERAKEYSAELLHVASSFP
jgi:hypothetical protein